MMRRTMQAMFQKGRLLKVRLSRAALALRVRARPLTCFSAQDATGTDVLVVTKVKLNTPEGKKRRGPPQ